MARRIVIAAGFRDPVKDWVTLRLCRDQAAIKWVRDTQNNEPNWDWCRMELRKYSSNEKAALLSPRGAGVPSDLAGSRLGDDDLGREDKTALLQRISDFLHVPPVRLPTPHQIKDAGPLFLSEVDNPAFRSVFKSAGYSERVSEMGREQQVRRWGDLRMILKDAAAGSVVFAGRHIPGPARELLRTKYGAEFYLGEYPREALSMFFKALAEERNQAQMEALAQGARKVGRDELAAGRISWAQEQDWQVGGDVLVTLTMPSGTGSVIFLGDLMGHGAAASAAAFEMRGMAQEYWRRADASHQDFLKQLHSRLSGSGLTLDHFLAIIGEGGSIEYSLSGSVYLWMAGGARAEPTGTPLGRDLERVEHTPSQANARRMVVATDGLGTYSEIEAWIQRNFDHLDADRICSQLLDETQNEKLLVSGDCQDDRTVLVFDRIERPPAR